MGTCFLDALKKSSKMKEMRTKKEKVEVLQQTIYSRKETGMNFLGFDFVFLASITLTLISSAAIIGCFRKINFQGFNLVI